MNQGTGRLGLGTVQFGLDYGISNLEGQTSPLEAAEILRVASRHQIEVLDTALLYGSSETVLGERAPADSKFRIVTKTGKFAELPSGENAAGVLKQQLRGSLDRLKCESVYGLLIHDGDDLTGPHGAGLMAGLLEARERGWVRKIGVSVYSADQIDKILGLYSIDLIQLPLSILDQRLISSGHIKKLKAAGVEIHARSVFLQGLIFLDPDLLPPHFDSVRELLRRFHSWVRDQRLSVAGAALGFVTRFSGVDVALCGVGRASQLEELVASLEQGSTMPDEHLAQFAVDDPSIVNPSNWSANWSANWSPNWSGNRSAGGLAKLTGKKS